jgi:glyoxylase-like metal-dependent hydrolase (beta-lactamase superfamily II)
MPHTEIAPGVIQVDTLLGGWAEVTAGYLITGTEPVLVETGSQTSVPALLAALDELGVAPEELAGIAVTHIHLDHAGGVGDVAAAFPKATVYVHEKGARHLVDPTKLVDSAALVYGDLLDSLYGRLTATDPTRVRVLHDGDDLMVSSNRRLTTVDSPGHAKHHLALHDSESGLLFAGDAVGVRLPAAGILRPATPPPDFDLDQAIASLRRFADRQPSGVALAHFGLVPEPLDTLAEAEEILTRWAEVATAAWQEGRDIADALDDAFAVDPATIDPEAQEILETLNGIHSNAAGFRRWLDKGGHVHGPPGTTTHTGHTGHPHPH